MHLYDFDYVTDTSSIDKKNFLPQRLGQFSQKNNENEPNKKFKITFSGIKTKAHVYKVNFKEQKHMKKV